MKKILPLALLLLAVAAAAAAARWWRSPAPEWTTDSPAALAEFEAGEQAMQKLYATDAGAHFARALEHDPHFAAAKVRMFLHERANGASPERLAELIAELGAIELDRLNPRERLLVGWVLARADQEPERARALLDDYLAEHPDDPYALSLACDAATGGGEVEEAERCFARLIELDPNRVQAQNVLGYLAMARGDFAAAEERFEIYRYVAPDQANPHDSLGELYLLTGRYAEAERQFERAVAVKTDFCASWLNLVLVELLARDFAAAEERAAEARRADGCTEPELAALDCRVELWRAAAEGRWDDVVERGAKCEQAGELLVLRHWAAWELGDQAAASAVVEQVRSYGDDPMGRPVQSHFHGVGLLHQGDPAAAAAALREIDERMAYESQGWIFKLFNRQVLAMALEAAGRREEAAAVRAELAAVNPRLAADGGFPIGETTPAR